MRTYWASCSVPPGLGAALQVKPPNLELQTSSAQARAAANTRRARGSFTRVCCVQRVAKSVNPLGQLMTGHLWPCCARRRRGSTRLVNDHPAVTPGNRNQLCAACFRLHDCCFCGQPGTRLLLLFICATSKFLFSKRLSTCAATATATKSWRAGTNPGPR